MLPVSGADVVLQTVVAPEEPVVRLGDVAKIKSENDKKPAALGDPAAAGSRTRTAAVYPDAGSQDLLAAQGEDMSALNFSGELMVEIAPPAEKNLTTERDRRPPRGWAGTSTVAAASMNVVPEANLAEAGGRATHRCRGQRASKSISSGR